MDARQRYALTGLRLTREQAQYILDLIKRAEENGFQRGKVDVVLEMYKSGELPITDIDKVRENVSNLAQERMQIELDKKELVDKYTLFVV